MPLDVKSFSLEFQSSPLLCLSLQNNNFHIQPRRVTLTIQLYGTHPFPSMPLSPISISPMPSERKHHQSANGQKPFKNIQNQGATNVSNAANSQTFATFNDSTFLQQSSQPQTNGSTHRDTLTSTQLQPSTHTTFQYLPRPWTQDAVNSNTSANVNGVTPMERWHDESTYDQPWHAIEGVYLHDGGDLDMVLQDNNMDSERKDGLARNADSMACHTSGV